MILVYHYTPIRIYIAVTKLAIPNIRASFLQNIFVCVGCLDIEHMNQLYLDYKIYAT